MRRPSQRKKTIYVLIILMVLNLTLLTVSLRETTRFTALESVLSVLLSPAQEIITQISRLVTDVWHGYFYLVNLRKQNELLQQELRKLRAQSSQFKEMELENRRLKEMLRYEQATQTEMVIARIIAREPSNWTKVITINVGEKAGAKKGLPVVTDQGLAGQIISTYHQSSRVMLITDLRSSVDALMQRSRGGGVVVGEANGLCRVKYFPIDQEVKIGDQLITSGLGGVYPKGLTIGKVSRIQKSQYGLFQELEVTPAVDLERSEEVFIILNPEISPTITTKKSN